MAWLLPHSPKYDGGAAFSLKSEDPFCFWASLVAFSLWRNLPGWYRTCPSKISFSSLKVTIINLLLQSAGKWMMPAEPLFIVSIRVWSSSNSCCDPGSGVTWSVFQQSSPMSSKSFLAIRCMCNCASLQATHLPHRSFHLRSCAKDSTDQRMSRIFKFLWESILALLLPFQPPLPHDWGNWSHVYWPHSEIIKHHLIMPSVMVVIW